MIENTTISFRVPVPIRDELGAIADGNLLSVSDLCRRSILNLIRETKKPEPTSKPNKSVDDRSWLIG